MKYPGVDNNSSCGSVGSDGIAGTKFCEQFDSCLQLYDQWNDCEKTVALCALLKRIPYSNLKFLQLSIDNNLAQTYNSQSKLKILESNSNNAVFLNKLANKYKNFGTDTVSQSKESLLFFSDKHDKKEDILNDILMYLPLLKSGNDEAKNVYLNLIPVVVEDSIRQIVPSQLVQQIFSYLLIHPAITNEDRRTFSQWIRPLQDHISTNFVKPHHQTKNNNQFPYTANAGELQSPYLTSSTSSLSSASWQTVAVPNLTPSCSSTTTDNNKATSTAWEIARSIQVTQDFCDDLNEFTKTIGNTSTSTQNPNTTLANSSSHVAQTYDKSNSGDDLHVSFSKNGTEILDFDYDDFKSNTQIAFDLFGDLLTVPSSQWDLSAIKTRRSNSLTTAPSLQNTCSSAENLAAITQKPRSFSLSGESTKNNLTSHGSETRLDDLNKPNYLRYSTHSIGMSGIGQWLKSLRLHKYVWLFTNLTYEQMLDITEDYLENLGVTKGARHKLVLCINKLRDRVPVLQQMEKDLMTGVRQTRQVLEELTTIVLTPMKPVDMYKKDDVAASFYKVLDYIATMAENKLVAYTQQDEDSINVILWLLERALHNEAFMAQTNQLKEHKYKLNKIKSQFVPKNHYGKSNGGNGAVNKPRWSNNPKHKQGNTDGPKHHRKNSNTNIQHFNQNMVNTNQITNSQGNLQSNTMFYPSVPNVNNNNYAKSSSYPNFVTAAAAAVNNTLNNLMNLSNQQHQPQTTKISQQVEQLDSQTLAALEASLAYHRHSLNNLITIPQALVMQHGSGLQINSGGGSTKTSTSLNNENLIITPSQKDTVIPHTQSSSVSNFNQTNTNSIGDINSRLEFLCLQMTEQAIN